MTKPIISCLLKGLLPGSTDRSGRSSEDLPGAANRVRSAQQQGGKRCPQEEQECSTDGGRQQGGELLVLAVKE